MVTKAELVAVSRKEGIPLGTVEKDYILTFVLKKIAGSEFGKRLAFKGGTALHKLYLHRRFSVDLDFTELSKINADRLKKVVETGEVKSRIKDIHQFGKSIRITIGYVSALEFPNRIFLDISKREQPIMPPIKKIIHSPFFEGFEVLTYRLEELLAEKIRALMQRNEPRDYLDVYYIAESGEADFGKAIEIAGEKLSAFRERFDKRKIIEDTELVRGRWNRDLTEIIPSVPNFDEVLKKIKDIFK